MGESSSELRLDKVLEFTNGAPTRIEDYWAGDLPFVQIERRKFPAEWLIHKRLGRGDGRPLHQLRVGDATILFERDSNGDGVVDEVRLMLTTGVRVSIVDTNHDGSFDVVHTGVKKREAEETGSVPD